MNINNEAEYCALGELTTMSLAVNYYNWIWKSIVPYIGNRIIEVGAGNGNFTQLMMKKEIVFATDIAQNCIDILQNRFKGNNNIIVDTLDITRIHSAEYWKDRDIDTIVCLNVLEHIEDDISALKNMASIIRRNAHIIIMVPAFQFIYGTIDTLDGHYRRYTKTMLRSKLLAANIEPMTLYYFNSVGLLAWYYTNRIAKDKNTSVSKTILYDKYIVPWLSNIEKLIRPPFGQSAIGVGRKK